MDRRRFLGSFRHYPETGQNSCTHSKTRRERWPQWFSVSYSYSASFPYKGYNCNTAATGTTRTLFSRPPGSPVATRTAVVRVLGSTDDPHVEPLLIRNQTVCPTAIGVPAEIGFCAAGAHAAIGQRRMPMHDNAVCMAILFFLFFENTIPRRLPAPDHQMDSGRSYAVGGPREETADSNT